MAVSEGVLRSHGRCFDGFVRRESESREIHKSPDILDHDGIFTSCPALCVHLCVTLTHVSALTTHIELASSTS
jgi:hypothetical protein